MEMTNAPGLSAFNKVERRMYHFSKELTGIVLPHDTFGSHLKNGKTVDEDLERKNFKAAGEVLANIWEGLEIDGHKVDTEFIEESPGDEVTQFQATAKFKSRHVFETQYMVCVLKCDDRSCCKEFRTSVDIFFPDRRIPALIPIKRTSVGPTALTLGPDIFKQKLEFLAPLERILMEDKLVPCDMKAKYGKSIPYDIYFPTCQKKVDSRTCKICMKYHSTIKSLKEHNRVCKRTKPPKKSTKKPRRIISTFFNDDSEEGEAESNAEEDEDAPNTIDQDSESEELEVESVRISYSVSYPGSSVETILNLREWLKSPWQADL